MSTEAAVHRVERMVKVIRHRGPDDEGIEVVSRPGPGAEQPNVVFGHSRLSIIDLSATGHQPMRELATGAWISFNGEIYNFVELRTELQKRGHQFRGRSDTEVILKAYAEWGIGCWRRLNGIFAFALWDPLHQELHLVRDHLGVKPLYYATASEGLVFGSEVRAILASNLVEARLSHQGLTSYLKYGSLQDPCTVIAGIRSLPPGCYVTCDAAGKIAQRSFWGIQECLVRNWETHPAPEGVIQKLEGAVRRQMVADVPVGVFLSGGLDSTAIVALAARAKPCGLQTFCIGLEQPDFDESQEAAATARFFGCQHTNLILEGRTVRAGLGKALASYDQPSVDGLNTYFVAKLVRETGVKVALSGLGGDELFVGYNGFRKALALERAGGAIRWIPRRLRHILSSAVDAVSAPGNSVGATIAEVLTSQPQAWYFASRTLFSDGHIARLVPSPAANSNDSEWRKREADLTRETASLDSISRVSNLELQSYMLSTLLRDADQMSMAHGLELRVPLLDLDLVEHVLPIPSQQKFDMNRSKWLLANAISDSIPAEFGCRRKRGFTLPFGTWLRRDLAESMSACFQSSDLRGPWDRQVFRNVWTDFERGRVAWSRVLMLFVLENWLAQNGVRA